MNTLDSMLALLASTKGKPRIAVIGDLMLDRHIYCDVLGLSPEDEGTLKAKVLKTSSGLGGAANVAANLKALGASVFVGGVVGEDAEGSTVNELLYNVADHSCVPALPERRTTLKTRYLTSRGRHLIRIDSEDVDEIPEKTTETLLTALHDFAPDIIAVSDYKKGVVTASLIEELSTGSVAFVVDPKRSFDFYGTASVLTPNLNELQEAVGMPGCTSLSKMLEKLPLSGSHLFVKLSEKGAVLYNSVFEWIPQLHVKARARELGDPTGCGDSLLAGLVFTLALGGSLPLACQAAVAAGSVAFDHTGAYSPSMAELVDELRKKEEES